MTARPGLRGPGELPAGSVPPPLPRPVPAPTADSPRLAELSARLRSGDASAPSKFWAEVTATGTPLVEPLTADPDGAVAATFLWRGPAGAVLLLVNKLFDRANLRASLMRPVPGTGIWYLTYRLPADWRGSYQIAVTDAVDPADDDLRRLTADARSDPLNRATLPQPPGRSAKSVAEMPRAPQQRYLHRRPGVPNGTVSEHRIHSAALAAERHVWLYTPPIRSHDDPPQLLVLLDGDIWAQRIPIFPTLDNLIAEAAIPPVAAVVVHPGHRATRFTDYACNEPFAAFLSDELTPWAAERLDATTDPRRTVIAGQSLGGLAAAFAAYRAPGRFGNVLAQSGSFWWKSGTPHDTDAEWLTRRFADTPRLPLRFHIEVGRDEWVSLDPTRRLRDVLRAKGYPLTYTEFNGGHDQACWRGSIADALKALSRG